MLERLNGNVQGLSDEEVVRIRETAGWNRLMEPKGSPWYLKIISTFANPIGLVLLAAVGISMWLGEWLDAWSILAIILMNAGLEWVQESRAEKALSKLQTFSAPKCRVYRSSDWKTLPADELVPGDYIRVTTGDRIPADVVWTSVTGLHVDESMLTGESEPIAKIIGGQDGLDRGSMGTMVVSGHGLATVKAIGQQTSIGQIASLLAQSGPKQTPLQQKLHQLGGTLVWTALGLTALVVWFGYLRGYQWMEMLMSGVSLAVAVIPEGLPAIVTVALALGVQRMSAHRAIVRRLTSVETLGCATVICSDKTGTLTENRMVVTDCWQSGESVDRLHVSKEMLRISQHCSNAEFGNVTNSDNAPTWFGDPTEVAIAGWADAHVKEVMNRVAELPFDSDRKRMTVMVEDQGHYFIFMKGAAEKVLPFCMSINWHGIVEPLTVGREQLIKDAVERLAMQGKRVLAMAYRANVSSTDQDGKLKSSHEDQMVFAGLIAMSDPPRAGVKEAIRDCRDAGIRPIMITGDHPQTAMAIASEIGLLRPNAGVLTGSELDSMDEKTLGKKLVGTDVFARVTPAHKMRIVNALQAQRHIVAMTGDGVNDAPALKSADIGVAMGKQGTDVARESADLVLSDDHFATIVYAVREGRTIYDNIRKFIRYLLASNVGEIITMLGAMMLGLPLPLLPVQILWVNLVTDGLPALALGMDPAEGNQMNRAPRSRNEHILGAGLGWKIISRGVMIGIFTLVSFALTLRRDGFFMMSHHEQLHLVSENGQMLMHAQTVAFAALVMAQLIHVFDCRNSESIFQRNPFSNRPLVFAVLLSFGLMIAAVYVSYLQPIFKTVDLDWADIWLVMTCAVIPSIVFAGGRKRKKIKGATRSGIYENARFGQ